MNIFKRALGYAVLVGGLALTESGCGKQLVHHYKFDLNGDGVPEDITAIYSPRRGTYQLTEEPLNSDGRGNGKPRTLFKLNCQPSSIDIRDVNGNGHLDLVYTGCDGKEFVMRNNGKGNFGAPEQLR